MTKLTSTQVSAVLPVGAQGVGLIASVNTYVDLLSPVRRVISAGIFVFALPSFVSSCLSLYLSGLSAVPGAHRRLG